MFRLVRRNRAGREMGSDSYAKGTDSNEKNKDWGQASGRRETRKVRAGVARLGARAQRQLLSLSLERRRTEERVVP